MTRTTSKPSCKTNVCVILSIKVRYTQKQMNACCRELVATSSACTSTCSTLHHAAELARKVGTRCQLVSYCRTLIDESNFGFEVDGAAKGRARDEVWQGGSACSRTLRNTLEYLCNIIAYKISFGSTSPLSTCPVSQFMPLYVKLGNTETQHFLSLIFACPVRNSFRRI